MGITPEDFERLLAIARSYDVAEFTLGDAAVTFLPKRSPAVKERKEPPAPRTALDVALEGATIGGDADRIVEWPEGINDAPRPAGVQWADDEPPANKPQE